MLTKEQIVKNLQNDPTWEPAEDASPEDWELYEEVCIEMEASGELDLGDDLGPDEDDKDD
ncbi:hypothetical protein A3K34_01810 [candidate division WWE3 bacterium RIFOXYC1_FULL_40_10]|uniref:Uncharacterized protein n=1 Tax=candidate division WWE3 bacterium RIFOXYA2_FULL_46_9 TaxID=1802636 RepID=A0A1F4W2K2_UNCKA|nr:MAG: hypothetical protein A3K58_01810 [candidate division WWE3 bacterium RIFOXYB1_FULL_40_22]OGC61599.1 MAG: hypothetical protein A3K37_01810 [candidate division WWE3 bacterium RIFOXYA1_FULL_40_11]OGC63646.1 MAG: hypothetical protein A2264_04755 [candidate division WWE3 bacterium RIFOXYA2_FULL_46_9]OGC64723.1 MAG: hypothetical protein A2326_01640 [candidate division WWE3 bacterium RIFOXYB2_FULL_41_6]OGC65982.1 MAG: hypothetical protein A3K34_01810 [candidate division WWE3 bacterium RIFOXYC1_